MSGPKTYTETEVIDNLGFAPDDAQMGTDNDGQIVLYTGYYRWNDGTIRDEKEPEAKTTSNGD